MVTRLQVLNVYGCFWDSEPYFPLSPLRKVYSSIDIPDVVFISQLTPLMHYFVIDAP